MPFLQIEVDTLEFIFKSKINQIGDDSSIKKDDFIYILNQIYFGVEYEDIIKEVSCLATSDGNEEMNLTKFIAFIEMVYLRKGNKQRPIAISLYRVMEQLRLDYLKQEGGNNYIEAGKVQGQIDKLLQSESSRRRKDIIAKQNRDTISLKMAHDEQYVAFNQDWNNFFINFEKRAEISVNAMKEQHVASLEQHLKQLEIEAQSKTPLWSKELKQFRKREKMLAYQENYAEAQKVKVVVDALEKEEKKKMIIQHRDGTIARKETALRQKQDAEVKVLLKKIELQRETNTKKRNSDCKRLLQRNRNIQESLKLKKQTIECHQHFDNIDKEIKKELHLMKFRM